MQADRSDGASGPAGAPTRSSPSWLRFVLVACSLLVASSAALCTHRVLNPPIPAIPEFRTVTETVRPTAAVVTALRDLARLETAEAHVERVVDLRDRQSSVFGLVGADDALLLVAAGDVVAGVDLGALADDAIDADPESGRARLRLPHPSVFSARLDNDATYVHTRSTDLLATRSETLETRARREAERTLRAAALEAGILRRAGENAERTVRALVGAMGYGEVTIEWTETEVSR